LRIASSEGIILLGRMQETHPPHQRSHPSLAFSLEPGSVVHQDCTIPGCPGNHRPMGDACGRSIAGPPVRSPSNDHYSADSPSPTDRRDRLPSVITEAAASVDCRFQDPEQLDRFQPVSNAVDSSETAGSFAFPSNSKTPICRDQKAGDPKSVGSWVGAMTRRRSMYSGVSRFMCEAHVEGVRPHKLR